MDNALDPTLRKEGADDDPEEKESSLFHNVAPGELPATDAGYLELLSYEVFSAALGDRGLVEDNWPEILYGFKSFHVQRVAEFNDNDLRDVGERVPILREKPQLSATVNNAAALLQIAQVYGSFKQYLRSFDKDGPAELMKDIAERFTMVDSNIFQDFLKSTGARIMIPEATRPKKTAKQNRPQRRPNRQAAQQPTAGGGNQEVDGNKKVVQGGKPAKAEQPNGESNNHRGRNRRPRKRRFGFRKKKQSGNQPPKIEHAAAAAKE